MKASIIQRQIFKNMVCKLKKYTKQEKTVVDYLAKVLINFYSIL